MAAKFTATFEIEKPYRVTATIYKPNGEFLEMVQRKTVCDAMRALADEVAEWAINEATQQMVRDHNEQEPNDG